MSKQFRVIIIGGSIAGLTLANLLQKYGIDYVVLEAYDTITPQVGASIGFAPHGLRLIDQMGCYEDMLAGGCFANTMTTRNASGRIMYSHSAAEHLLSRHYYGHLVMERRTALGVFYRHIQDKSKVLVGQRVIKIDQGENNVQVYTKTGDIFEGDIVVGADGIHSTTRSEMWRLAKDKDPSYFAADGKKAMPTLYGCVFAISSPTGDIKSSDICLTHMKNASLALMCGPNDEPYWFCFFKLPKPYYGLDLPRYSKEDELAIIKEHSAAAITNEVSFGDLYKNVKFSRTTALPHHVFEKWYYNRTVLVGDSAHKFNPISGQGGNNAIESAVAFADLIHAALKRNGGTLSQFQVQEVFAAFQSMRYPRVEPLVKDSILIQRISAWDTTLFQLMDNYVVPYLDTSIFMDQFTGPVLGGYNSQLGNIDRPHIVQFDNELLTPPRSRGGIWLLLEACAFISLTALAYYGMFHLPMKQGTLDDIMAVINARNFENYEKKPLMSFSHLPIIGLILNFLVTTLFPTTEGLDRPFQSLVVYFFVSIFVVFLTWAVESCRVRNQLLPTRGAFLFGLLGNIFGVAFAAPIYYLLDIIFTQGTMAFWPTNTLIIPSKAKAILPAVLLAMLLPTLLVLLFAPSLDSNTHQAMTIVWVLYPVTFFFLHRMLSRGSEREKDQPALFIQNASKSVSSLAFLYHFAFIVSSTTHFVMVGSTFRPPPVVPLSWSFRNVPVALAKIFLPVYNIDDLFQNIHNMFIWDFFVTIMAALLWCYISLLDLSRVGIVKIHWFQLAVGMAVSTILVGPAATVSACCAWRENQLMSNVLKRLK